jgi:hypothetical protein
MAKKNMKTVMCLASKYRKSGLSPKEALKKAWKEA